MYYIWGRFLFKLWFSIEVCFSLLGSGNMPFVCSVDNSVHFVWYLFSMLCFFGFEIGVETIKWRLYSMFRSSWGALCGPYTQVFQLYLFAQHLNHIFLWILFGVIWSFCYPCRVSESLSVKSLLKVNYIACSKSFWI